MKPIFSFASLATALLATAGAVVVACSDDPSERPGGDLDGGNVPNEASPYDAGPAPDAKDPYAYADEEVSCAGEAGSCVKELAAGDGHFCARMGDGTVRCWGGDTLGNLGRDVPTDGGRDASSFIEPVRGLAGVTQISAADDTTCARLEDGGVRCWGGNKSAQLGLDESAAIADEDAHPTPSQPAVVGNARRVDVGHGSVCALLATGKLTCWGSDASGQLARPIPEEPWNLAPGEAAIDPVSVEIVQIGNHSSIGLTQAGDLWVWGALAGEEGFCAGVVSTLSPVLAPRKVVQLSKVTSFGVSTHSDPERAPSQPGLPPPPRLPQQAHACAIMNGEVHCWGRSDKTALCTGLPDPERTPAYAPIFSKAWPQRLAVGREITCVRLTDGTIQCCGSNDKGRLGFPPSTTHAPFFRPVGTFKGRAVQVATSNASVCALVRDGTVECWGSNLRGELGSTARDEAAHPETHTVAF